MRCSVTKSSGQPCKAQAVKGTTVCRAHGGTSSALVRGPGNPNYKTGRYSKAMPARLLERYKEAAADKELLALREDVALVDTRLEDVLRRVDTGESGRLWRELQRSYEKLLDARRRSDTGELAAQLNAIGGLIKDGTADTAAWTEIMGLLEQRRKLVETEHKRLVAMHQVLTAEEAMTLLTVIVDIVSKHVTDKETLTGISRELNRLVSHGSSPAAGS